MPPLFALLAIGLVPWTIALGLWMLPGRTMSAHYSLAWTGFDVFLLASLAGVATSAVRGSPRLHGMATTSAALLIVDAWFDVITASNHWAFTQALLTAGLAELPLAALNIWVAEHAEHVIMRCREVFSVTVTVSAPSAPEGTFGGDSE